MVDEHVLAAGADREVVGAGGDLVDLDGGGAGLAGAQDCDVVAALIEDDDAAGVARLAGDRLDDGRTLADLDDVDDEVGGVDDRDRIGRLAGAVDVLAAGPRDAKITVVLGLGRGGSPAEVPSVVPMPLLSPVSQPPSVALSSKSPPALPASAMAQAARQGARHRASVHADRRGFMSDSKFQSGQGKEKERSVDASPGARGQQEGPPGGPGRPRNSERPQRGRGLRHERAGGRPRRTRHGGDERARCSHPP
ncbi:hypothetical protein [Nannocystis pusilla]|uniref:hypothetical protein n=1 Tax=Nannocystis pusilla TaxID=889268 RepID=UPI003B7BDBE5